MSTLKDIKNNSTTQYLISQIENSKSDKLRARYVDDLIQHVHNIVITNLWSELMQHEELRKRRIDKNE